MASDFPPDLDFDYFPPPPKPKDNPITDKPKRTVKSRSPSTRARVSAPSRSTAKPRPQATDYREAVSGVLQLPCAFLLVSGQALKKPALIADAATWTQAIPEIAVETNSLAQNDPRVAAILDRILTVGPYGKLITACMKPVAQTVVNHRPQMLGALQPFGAVDPNELLNSFLPEEAPSDNGAKTSTATA